MKIYLNSRCKQETNIKQSMGNSMVKKGLEKQIRDLENRVRWLEEKNRYLIIPLIVCLCEDRTLDQKIKKGGMGIWKRLRSLKKFWMA